MNECFLFIDPTKNGHDLPQEQLMIVLIKFHIIANFS